jgi:hypothetical protein
MAAPTAAAWMPVLKNLRRCIAETPSQRGLFRLLC